MSRLSQQQLQAVKDKAISAHNRLLQETRRQVTDEERGGGGLFFTVLFRIAGALIEGDVEQFCDRADEIFEEIEAHGQEPQLDTDWLSEITGDRDTFNFSTDNLVSALLSKPRRNRDKAPLTQAEIEHFKNEIQAAIIDEEPHNLQQALAVSHDEDPTLWIESILHALKTGQGQADFWQLKMTTGLSAGELLLGLLLGQEYWTLSQNHFYTNVTINLIV